MENEKLTEEEKKLSAEISNLILNDLGLLKDVVPITLMESEVGTLTFLDYVYEGKGKTKESEEGVIGLKVFTKYIEAQAYKASIATTTEQLKDLNKTFGIDVIEMLKSTLINEVVVNIYKHVFDKIKGLCGKNEFEAKLTWKDKLTKFFYNIIGKPFKKKIVVDNIKMLISKILMSSSLIAVKGRIGAGNFIICSSGMNTILQDSPGFVYAGSGEGCSITLPYLYSGNIANSIRVYVDMNMKFNDKTVYVGRTNQADQPGCQLMFYKYGSSIIADNIEVTLTPRITAQVKYIVADAGVFPQNQYFKIDFDFTKRFTEETRMK
jgi:hypothetical protein